MIAADNPSPVNCKICAAPSYLFGAEDFSKSCLEAQGKRLNLSGFIVYYRRCSKCGFIFTCSFDSWPQESFKNVIYNEKYIVVDPEFRDVRPTGNAKSVAEVFHGARESLRLLDYGGGDGLFAQRMSERGFTSTATYDPFSKEFANLPDGTFDLITSFEVLEHVPFPDETVARMASLLKKGGIIFFTTLLQPHNILTIGTNWWYAAPRNGHVSLYSAASLHLLFKKHGLRVGSFADSTHVAYTEIPHFASHLKFTPLDDVAEVSSLFGDVLQA